MRSAIVILIVAGSLAGMGSLYSLKRQTQLADPIAPKSVDRWPDQVAADGVVEGAVRKSTSGSQWSARWPRLLPAKARTCPEAPC